MRVFTHFDDMLYRRSHLRAPAGRGSWAFKFSLGSDAPWFAPGSVTLAEAKILARAEARARVAALRPNAKQFDMVVDVLP